MKVREIKVENAAITETADAKWWESISRFLILIMIRVDIMYRKFYHTNVEIHTLFEYSVKRIQKQCEGWPDVT